MSQESIELGRQVLDAVAGRDLSRLIAFTDPKVEWHSFFAVLGEHGVYRGHDGLRQYVSDLHDAFEIVRPDVDDGPRGGRPRFACRSRALPRQGQRRRNRLAGRLDVQVP
jgi:SnoaL-like protein